MKQGLNPNRHKLMLAMLKDGKSAEEVSEWLQVVPEYVAKFAPKPKKKPVANNKKSTAKKPRQGTKTNGDK